jgi:hypothetical protein
MKSRLLLAGLVPVLWACSPDSPQTPAPTADILRPAPFSLDALPPEVRTAVGQARAAEDAAKAKAEIARAGGTVGVEVKDDVVDGIYGGPALMAHYEGEMKDRAYEGLGVLTLPDSAISQAGEFRHGLMNGWGVERSVEGRPLYEGGWKDAARDGLGVEWTQDGKVAQAGLWKDGGLAN